ncbi:MAG: Stk1 family PASTA domain-containing Ser/Thr kinase [Thermoanaerobacteraceae bacterium]|nr:Stk1 family PASTA domain-containing Ser/Thr kinase [Thermoanaerobacteraceae bacterium]
MIGKMLGNRYEILEEIGQGGMGIVYKARCHLLNRLVAIKILRPEFSHDEEFIKRFKYESQSAASLSHPNIVSIYDVGNEGDIYYIVMEYVNGKTLKQIIKESNGPLPLDRAMSITSQVLRALDNAHRHNIIHRDIKPHNILLTEDGIAKVTDFGIARAATDYTLTYNKNIIGTAQYFSPEQARGGIVDEKSDIYSLGIVMYEMLTGQVPFEGDSPISVALKHIEENLIPPSRLNHNIPKGIEEIIMKATEKDPNRRYSSANEMLTDINKFASDPDNFRIRKIEEDAPTKIIPPINYDKTRMTERTDVKKGHNRIIPIIITTIIILIIMGGIAGATLYFINRQTVAEVEVPSIVGMNIEEAERLLKQQGLSIEVIGEDYSSEPAGVILSQDPESPIKVKQNYKVKVRISKGIELTKVPLVENMSVDEAVSTLEDAGLKPNIIPTYDDIIPENQVISQNPAANEEIESGSQVNLYVSKGKEKITMINIVGKTLDDAEKLLAENGIALGNITEQENAGPENIVLSQSINPGDQVEKGKTVDLVISKKPTTPVLKNITVPLPDIPGEMKVVVIKRDALGETTVYSGMNTYQDSPLNILNVPMKGHVVIEVYINDDNKPYSRYEDNI